MNDAGYVALALFQRLRQAEIEYSVLGDTRDYPSRIEGEVELVVSPAGFAAMPDVIAQFCRDFDLYLVQLLEQQSGARRFVLAWSNDLGRPRYLAATVASDYSRAGRLLLSADELLRRGRSARDEAQVRARGFDVPAPALQFIHYLLSRVDAQQLSDRDAAWLSELWSEDPAGAGRELAHFWPGPAEAGLLRRAVRTGDWSAVRGSLDRLRRALHRQVPRSLPRLLRETLRRALGALRASGALITFEGGDAARRSDMIQQMLADLAPAFRRVDLSAAHGGRLEALTEWLRIGVLLARASLVAVERRAGAGTGRLPADLRVVLEREAEPTPGWAPWPSEMLQVEPAQPLAAAVGAVNLAVLRTLAWRIERRYPDAATGANPRAARVLQFCCRYRIPLLGGLLRMLLNSELDCRLRSPILMPHPYGIVIHRNAAIGSRVTVMQQVAIGPRGPAQDGAPTIEDGVYIGAGARVLGAIRVGRGAVIGANSVVTRDVPSYSTVVGANRILAYRAADPDDLAELEEQLEPETFKAAA